MMGISPRTLRDRLARGDVVGAKRGGRWFVDSHRMPLTEVQRISMQARAAEIRGVVEAALPSRAAATRERKHRSVADLDVFREARNVAASMRAC
ncbi:MAG: hypothetical protein GY711_15570, partial [bacterium]|nr:hypothetical protein [bacterium]